MMGISYAYGTQPKFSIQELVSKSCTRNFARVLFILVPWIE